MTWCDLKVLNNKIIFQIIPKKLIYIAIVLSQFWELCMDVISKRMIVGFSLFFSAVLGQTYGDNYNCCESVPCCNRFWFDADYLYWEIKNSPEPVPLVIEQPIPNGPSTTVLGDKNVDLGWRSGAKFAVGYWFDNCRRIGAEVNYLFLSKESKKYTVSSDANGSPSRFVPYFDVQTGLEALNPISTPGLYRGFASLKIDNWIQGTEVNIVGSFPSNGCNMKFGWLAGFRWWNFNEHLKFFVDSPLVSPPSIYNYNDTFKVKNNFYGGQIGGSFDYCYCNFFINLRGKVALGSMYQENTIDGSFTTNQFTGVPETFVGGFFALPTNIGHHKKTRFSVLPELNANLGYQITNYCSIKLGYSVMYVSNVLWAGKQIDRNLNPSQSANIVYTPNPVLVGESSPKVRNKSECFWAQGLNVGLEFQF